MKHLYVEDKTHKLVKLMAAENDLPIKEYMERLINTAWEDRNDPLIRSI